MADVIRKTPNALGIYPYIQSVNTPEYPSATWLVDPDLSGVAGVPQHFWKVTDTGGSVFIVEEMTTSEKQAVLQASEEPQGLQGFEDDFFGALDSDRWVFTNTNGALTTPSAGIKRATVDPTAANFGQLTSVGMGITASTLQRARFRLMELTDGNQRMICGLYQDPSNFIAFRRTNANNWEAVANDGGSVTSVDTGVPGDTTNFHVFALTRNGSDAEFRIDGALVATIAGANLPGGGVFEFVMRLDALAGVSADREADIDAVDLQVIRV